MKIKVTATLKKRLVNPSDGEWFGEYTERTESTVLDIRDDEEIIFTITSWIYSIKNNLETVSCAGWDEIESNND